MEMVLNKDSEGLRQLKHQYDPARANQNLNEETQKLIQEGFTAQENSKEALLRTARKVGEI